MKDFKNNRRFEGGGRDGGRPSFGGGRDRDRQMFKTVCAKCGKTCEAPFRPNGDKPVYCSDCFVPQGPMHEKTGGDRNFAPRREFSAPSFKPRDDNRDSGEMKKSLESISYKLDKLITLMTPKAETPKAVVEKEMKPSKKVTNKVELKKVIKTALKPKKESKPKVVKAKAKSKSKKK